MASLIIEKQPTAEPVSLGVMKNFLRVTFTNDDVLIAGLIQAARELCEAFTNRSFCYKGYRQCHDAFPYATDTINSQNSMPPSYYAYPRYSTSMWNYSMQIKLFAAPLVSVERITYLNAGDSQYHDLVPTPPLWYPGTVYILNTVVMDNNGNQQKCTTAGTSTSLPPTWATALNASTTEASPDGGGEGTGPVVWQNIGPLNPAKILPGGPGGQFGLFMVDSDNEPARIFPALRALIGHSVCMCPTRYKFTLRRASRRMIPKCRKR
jgi:hypothetical protein